MRKLAGGLVFTTGLLTLVFSVIGILAFNGIVHWDWAVRVGDSLTSNIKATDKLSSNIVYGVWIAIGVVEMALAKASMDKARGIASFILLAIFGASLVLGLIHGIHTGLWAVATIINLVVTGIATAGLVAGIVKGE